MPADQPDNPPPVAAARIFAIYQFTKDMHIRTEGGQAEAAFELLVAACLIIHEARPMRPAAEMLSNVAANAETTALDWFADMIADFRKGDA